MFSVAAPLATFRGGALATQAVLAQSKASDNRGYYRFQTKAALIAV